MFALAHTLSLTLGEAAFLSGGAWCELLDVAGATDGDHGDDAHTALAHKRDVNRRHDVVAFLFELLNVAAARAAMWVRAAELCDAAARHL
jgi:hypothetical protein